MEPAASAHAPDLSYAARTNIGRVRANNEDHYLILADIGLFIVCDGMGGHQAGEVASGQACDTLQHEVRAAIQQGDAPLAAYQHNPSPEHISALRATLEHAIATAGHTIFMQAASDPSKSGMGTTCTAVWLIGHGKAILGHVGDSRLYILRANDVHQLSDDHTYVDELVKRGALTPEEARFHPNSNILTRGLGVQSDVDVDTLVFDLDPHDTILMCSDGLYNEIASDQLISDMFNQGPSLEDAVSTIVDHALEEGGHDNITAIAIRLPAQGGAFLDIAHHVTAHQTLAMLHTIPMFAQLAYQELVKVLGFAHHRNYARGDVIANAAAVSDTLYLVLAGEVTQTPSHHAATSSVHAGECIGQTNLIYDSPLEVTLTAASDVAMLTICGHHITHFIQHEPVIATKLLWGLSTALSAPSGSP